jgi:hypothetical protein
VESDGDVSSGFDYLNAFRVLGEKPESLI